MDSGGYAIGVKSTRLLPSRCDSKRRGHLPPARIVWGMAGKARRRGDFRVAAFPSDGLYRMDWVGPLQILENNCGVSRAVLSGAR